MTDYLAKNSIPQHRELFRDLQKTVKRGEQFRVESQILANRDLRAMAEEYGFMFLSEEPTQSPIMGAIRVCIVPHQNRWEYSLKGISIPDDWRCLDVGSGRNPWPRANVIVDAYADFVDYALPHQRFYKASITDGLHFKDKEFDYVTCWHVLEHVSDPLGAVKELSRVAKAGTIEVPHAMKDGLLVMPEHDHVWHCLPPPSSPGPLIFVRINKEWWDSLADREAQIAADSLYLSGTVNVGPMAVLRNYFRRTEERWNIIYHWTDKAEAWVIG